MGSLNINNYNRRDSFGLGWADQWDYKFNDEKLAASGKKANTGFGFGSFGGGKTKPGKENSVDQRQKKHKALVSTKKMMEFNRKVLSAANSSAVVAKSAANSSASKLKAGTTMGVKWIKKQCSTKALKSQPHAYR
ncbi:hypothetical protein KP509_03G049100 [Ceratopteris richardii]|uniref:Uncharacterized protein n=1 Tax=Ceratopteris richardii TaxID=49495 RepID=A0A8T2UZT4_CERRI|nr:hypothetical protein KP509_03G049100 [Ceratopteris richardii]